MAYYLKVKPSQGLHLVGNLANEMRQHTLNHSPKRKNTNRWGGVQTWMQIKECQLMVPTLRELYLHTSISSLFLKTKNLSRIQGWRMLLLSIVNSTCLALNQIWVRFCLVAQVLSTSTTECADVPFSSLSYSCLRLHVSQEYNTDAVSLLKKMQVHQK